MDITTIFKISVWIIPVILAVTIHEVAHGWMANLRGDSTARDMGRLSINPFKHIDLIGTVIVPAVLVMTTGYAFGWAKPVPVDFRKLIKPKQDMVFVALAGPVSNFIMAILWVIILNISVHFIQEQSLIGLYLLLVPVAGITINVILGVLNLLPIPPLDGGRVLAGLLPDSIAKHYSKIEPYGLFIILGLMLSGLLALILMPMIKSTLLIIAGLSGIDINIFAGLLNAIQ